MTARRRSGRRGHPGRARRPLRLWKWMLARRRALCRLEIGDTSIPIDEPPKRGFTMYGPAEIRVPPRSRSLRQRSPAGSTGKPAETATAGEGELVHPERRRRRRPGPCSRGPARSKAPCSDAVFARTAVAAVDDRHRCRAACCATPPPEMQTSLSALGDEPSSLDRRPSEAAWARVGTPSTNDDASSCGSTSNQSPVFDQ